MFPLEIHFNVSSFVLSLADNAPYFGLSDGDSINFSSSSESSTSLSVMSAAFSFNDFAYSFVSVLHK